MAEMTLAQLARRLDGETSGGPERVVRGVAPIETAREDEVTFLANKRYERYVAETRAAAVIVAADYAGPAPAHAELLRCKDAYYAFREAMVAFYGFREPPFEGVSAQACVHRSARLAEGVRVAPLATVSADCQVGPRTAICPGVFLGPGCRIGADCTLHPNVTLYEGTILGDRVTIHAGTSVGHDGFGYATHAGRHEKIPQAGWVEIEDDVEIGAGCAIDRATMGATVVGAGTKFSNLVAIGHGTKLGKHCLLVAQAGLAGSVMVGDYCVFAGQAGVVGHIRIGDGCKVAAQAGVTADLGAGQDVGGSPAMPLAQARRAWMSLRQLAEMRTALRKLAREVGSLRRRLREAGIDPDADRESGK